METHVVPDSRPDLFLVTSKRLPDLLLVGAPKCGTTSLAHWLGQHPDVGMGPSKELSFFDVNWSKGLDWYASQFDDVADRTVLFEATPTYLSEPGVARRIAATMPDTKFVVVLREPVSRAWSNYWFFVQWGLEKRPWQEALDIGLSDGGDFPGYLWRGHYGRQLELWHSLVGPDRLTVLLFDDLVADPGGAFAQVCRLSGIRDDVEIPDFSAKNLTRRPRSARAQRALMGATRRRQTAAGQALLQWNAGGSPVPAMPTETRRRLHRLFDGDRAWLRDELGVSLPDRWDAG